MITKESLTRENLGIVACCVMVAVNLGIALVALIIALVDDGPPRSAAAAGTPPAAVNDVSYDVPTNPYAASAPPPGETAGLTP